uniref:Fucosyltransferase n=1 Tax=Plectus sambesii TaxID=2011161 RepID=A0A914WA11_9BILA
MRVTLKKTVVATYLLFCATLTFLNVLLYQNEPTGDQTEASNVPSRAAGLFVTIFGRDSRKPLALLPEDSTETDRILEQIEYAPEISSLPRQPVKIFLPHGLGMYGGVSLGYKEFEVQNCRVKNCFITVNQRDAPSAEVVFFRDSLIFPKSYQRPQNQLWVMQLLENPDYTSTLRYANGHVNYTATYRWDSDIVTPYEKWVPLAQVPRDQRLPLTSKKLARKSDYAKGKSEMVAWFVSHCHTNNNRLAYAKKLSRHISVHIFGDCGNMVCHRRDERCQTMLDEDYKFYLSFENNNCEDYVTEKYFVNGLQHDIIPVVMGPPRSYYEKISPPHSFIHVDDFRSPKELAAYLHYLDKNDSAYNEYFAWKGTGQFINTKFWCRLCALAQNPRPKIHANIDGWWKKNSSCMSSSKH